MSQTLWIHPTGTSASATGFAPTGAATVEGALTRTTTYPTVPSGAKYVTLSTGIIVGNSTDVAFSVASLPDDADVLGLAVYVYVGDVAGTDHSPGEAGNVLVQAAIMHPTADAYTDLVNASSSGAVWRALAAVDYTSSPVRGSTFKASTYKVRLNYSGDVGSGTILQVVGKITYRGAPIVQQITANMLTTIEAIAAGTSYAETFEVSMETKLGNIPTPSTITYASAMLVMGPDSPNENSPINKDDIIQTYYIDCVAVESDSSTFTADKRQARMASDIRKALMVDYKRGTELSTGDSLAIMTSVRNASPLDLQQAAFRGVGLIVDVWYRTAQGDPYSL